MNEKGASPDLVRAKHLLTAGGFTCVLCRGDAVHTATERGVKPLLTFWDDGVDLHGFSAADKVVGKGAAFLYVLLGITAVYAPVISRGAWEILQTNHIRAEYDTMVDGIRNRAGTGMCPIESSLGDVRDSREALEIIRDTLRKLAQTTK